MNNGFRHRVDQTKTKQIQLLFKQFRLLDQNIEDSKLKLFVSVYFENPIKPSQMAMRCFKHVNHIIILSMDVSYNYHWFLHSYYVWLDFFRKLFSYKIWCTYIKDLLLPSKLLLNRACLIALLSKNDF